MTGVIEIAAEAERRDEARAGIVSRQQAGEQSSGDVPDNLPVHQFPATVEDSPEIVRQTWQERQAAAEDRERERRTYRGRVVAMLRPYMRYSAVAVNAGTRVLSGEGDFVHGGDI
jgi:hypothetical protein